MKLVVRKKTDPMERETYKHIPLENGHCLDIFDDSRKIGADAYVVIMTARMEIPVEKELFATENISDKTFRDIADTLGSPVVYEYRVERNMIMDREKDAVLEGLVNTFLENTGQYVTRAVFPEKLVLKEYRERIEKRRT